MMEIFTLVLTTAVSTNKVGRAEIAVYVLDHKVESFFSIFLF